MAGPEKENCDSHAGRIESSSRSILKLEIYNYNEEGIRFVTRIRFDRFEDNRVSSFEEYSPYRYECRYIYLYKRDLDREAAPIYRTSDFAGKVGHRISVIKDLIIE